MPAQTAARYSYDEVPYASFAYAHTHPDHLAVVGTLFGMNPAALETARVLELGSAGGGNILPLALRYPKASFTGIDLSQEHIAAADAQKDALGLKNIRFMQQDILAFDLRKHKDAFDYIICHGVYSWVPEAVSAKILDICRECLSDNGLAMVSYNTLPGWNAVRSLREMMRFHSDRFASPAEKTSEARKLLRFLAEAAPEGGGYRNMIEDELRMLASMNDSYLYHDHLEGINRQFYLHEFVGEAKKHGLDYVGDCSLTSMFVENLSPKAMEALSALNDLVLQEQYADFVVNRRFRCSILCRQGATVNRAMRDTQIMDYCLTANMAPREGASDFTRPVAFALKGGGGSFTSQNEVTGVVYDEIVKSGLRPIAAKDAVARAQARLKGVSPETVRAALVEHGLRLALRGFLSLSMNSPAFTDEISDKPIAYPLARLQAAQPGCASVTNVLAGTVRIDAAGARAIPLFDGTRTLDDIAAALAGSMTGDAHKVRQTVGSLAAQLAGQALLIG